MGKKHQAVGQPCRTGHWVERQSWFKARPKGDEFKGPSVPSLLGGGRGLELPYQLGGKATEEANGNCIKRHQKIGLTCCFIQLTHPGCLIIDVKMDS